MLSVKQTKTMKFIVLLLTILGVCWASKIETFEEFKAHFDKNYDSIEEELEAKLNFERSRLWIQQNQHRFDHELGITVLADLDEDSDFFQDIPAPVNVTSDDHHDGQSVLPDAYDWRQHIHMHEPEYQGLTCGSCWAFVSATCMESRIAITEKVTVHISRQELLDCTNKVVRSNQGCKGGHAYDGWQYAIKDGVHDSTVYPYHNVCFFHIFPLSIQNLNFLF